MKIDNRVIEMIQQIGEVKDISGETELFKSGIIDSLGIVNLLVAIEEELGVYIAITEFDREVLSTPDRIAEYIRERH